MAARKLITFDWALKKLLRSMVESSYGIGRKEGREEATIAMVRALKKR